MDVVECEKVGTLYFSLLSSFIIPRAILPFWWNALLPHAGKGATFASTFSHDFSQDFLHQPLPKVHTPQIHPLSVSADLKKSRRAASVASWQFNFSIASEESCTCGSITQRELYIK